VLLSLAIAIYNTEVLRLNKERKGSKGGRIEMEVKTWEGREREDCR
jgi:hypothetical protein